MKETVFLVFSEEHVFAGGTSDDLENAMKICSSRKKAIAYAKKYMLSKDGFCEEDGTPMFSHIISSKEISRGIELTGKFSQPEDPTITTMVQEFCIIETEVGE